MGKGREPAGILLYYDYLPFVDKLTDAQAGRLFRAILSYGQGGTAPDFGDDQVLTVVWSFVGPKIDADKAHNEDICKQRKAASVADWRGKKTGVDVS